MSRLIADPTPSRRPRAGAGADGAPRPAALGPLVFVVGGASLGVEIAAARLLAPYFGASTIVWANTIGIVLVALSAGYWFGGRLADRHPRPAGLGALILVAAALIAIVPFAARPFLGFSVRAFEGLSLATFAGSLLGVLILVAVPVALLGAVAPWAARLAVGEEAGRAGEAVGRLYAISTAGSLVGTMTAALVAIPLLGTQRTFIAFALALAAAAAIAIGPRALVVAAGLALALAIPPGAIKEGDDRVLYEGETVQQYVRIVERGDGSRAMELNEGQAVHSLWRPGNYLTGDYWDDLAVLPAIGPRPEPRRVAILGNAGGTVARAYGRYFPRTAVDAVEIDGELTSLGRRFLGLRNRRMTVHEADARPWLEAADGGYDAILVDAYRQPYIPFYLTTTEFFHLVAERLAPGGVAVVNVGHPEGSDALEQVLGATMASAFPRVLRDPVTATNTLLVGGTGLTAARLEAAAPELPRDLRRVALESAARLRPRLAGGEVYTDDRAPVEWLIDSSLLEYAGG